MITHVDEKILLSFKTYHFLTVDQVTTLHYSQGSSKYVNERLRLLTQAKYLQRLDRETINTPFVYCLGRKGVAFIREHSGDMTYSFTPSEHHTHTNIHMRHWLKTTDFLIAGERLPTLSTAQVVRLYHDLTLKRMLKPSKVVPDGFLDILYENEHTCVWVELDRGTEEQKNIRQKVAAIVLWCNQNYVETFSTSSLNICFATTTGQRRATFLEQWISQELENQEEAQWFLIAALPENPDSENIFFTPMWKRLGTTGFVSLL